MKQHGILLVGGGRTHQENYARQFASDSRCRLVGVTDEDNVSSSRARWNDELAQRLGVPLLDDLDSSLRRSDVDVASVCVEFERRARVGARCAAAGKHVYLDKPLATTNQEAEQLVSAIRQAGVKSQMFSMLRTPWVRRAREIVSSGRIGDLLGLHCDLLFAKGRAGSADLGRPRKEAYPPGRFTFIDSKRELFTTGVYSIGFMRWLSGRNVRRVYAQNSNYFFEEHQSNNVEDFSVATLEFEGGLVGTITGGRIGWLSHPLSGPVRVHLIGTGGSWMIDASEPRLEISCDRTQWRPGPPHPEDPMGFWSSTAEAMGGVDKFQWRALKSPDSPSDPSFFIDCIDQDRESDMSAVDGMEILRVLLTAYESAAGGKPVEVTG